MNILNKAIITLCFIILLCFWIAYTDDEVLLSVLILLFIYVGIPLLLLVITDLIINVVPKWLDRSQLLLHICAIFGAIVGFCLGAMAESIGHENTYLPAVIFPVLAYLAPFFLLLKGLPLSWIKKFYFPSNKDRE